MHLEHIKDAGKNSRRHCQLYICRTEFSPSTIGRLNEIQVKSRKSGTGTKKGRKIGYIDSDSSGQGRQ